MQIRTWICRLHLHMTSKQTNIKHQHIHISVYVYAKLTADSDRANNNSLIAHIQNLPGFDASKARIVQHYATPNSRERSASESPEKLLSPDPPIGPTAAELILPWRRDRSYQSIGKCRIHYNSIKFALYLSIIFWYSLSVSVLKKRYIYKLCIHIYIFL